MAKKRNLNDIDPNAPASHSDLTLLAGQIQHQFKEVDKKFEQVDERFEQIDARFEQVDKRFDKLETTIDRNHRELMMPWVRP